MVWSKDLKFYTTEQREFVEVLLSSIIGFYGENLQSVAVFGSFARNENRINSDLDLLIILKENQDKISMRNRAFMELERPLRSLEDKVWGSGVRMEISPLVLNSKEASSFNPLYLDMTRHVIIVRDDENFLKTILDSVTKKMKKWGSRRIDIGNSWYWDIIPGLKWGEKFDYDS